MPCTHLKDFPHGVEYGVNFLWLQETKYSTNPTKRRRQPTCLQKEITVLLTSKVFLPQPKETQAYISINEIYSFLRNDSQRSKKLSDYLKLFRMWYRGFSFLFKPKITKETEWRGQIHKCFLYRWNKNPEMSRRTLLVLDEEVSVLLFRQ